ASEAATPQASARHYASQEVSPGRITRMLSPLSRRGRALRRMSPRLALISLLSAVAVLAATLLAFRVTHGPNPMPVTSATGRDIRVSHDGFQDHIEPSVAVNPRDTRNLLGACQFHGERPPGILGTFAS